MKISPNYFVYNKLQKTNSIPATFNSRPHSSNYMGLSLNQANAVKVQALYSQSFGKKENYPVYAIDIDGNAIKFDSRKDISDKLGIKGNAISNCLNGHLKKTDNYVFVKAADIEVQNNDGTVSLKPDVLKEFREILRTQIYAIDADGNILKFHSRKEAEDKLNLDGPSITHCLNGAVNKVGNYTFVRAKDLEKEDENGRYVIDEKKKSELLKRFKTAVYVFSQDGKFKKFNSPKQLEESYSLTPATVRKCLSNPKKKTGLGFAYARATDVEKYDENGNLVLNQGLIKSKVSDLKKPKIYAIDSHGNYRVFKSRKEAAEILGVDAPSITHCIKGKISQTGGYAFASAKDIEDIDATPDTINAKVKEIFESAGNKSSVYAINPKTGETVIYKNAREAAIELNLDPSSVYKCVKGEQKTIGGLIFARCYDLQKLNADGQYVLDLLKTALLIKERTTRKS